jgi:hypothetical protein
LNAFGILAIGGLSLLFLSYFSGGLCMADQPDGGALCFHGFTALGKGKGGDAGPNLPATSGGGGGNCQFLGNGQVCWWGVSGGTGCINSNSKSSDWQTSSGRNTLCARARTAYLNAQKSAGGRTSGFHRHPAHDRRVAKQSAQNAAFARSYAAERLSIA